MILKRVKTYGQPCTFGHFKIAKMIIDEPNVETRNLLELDSKDKSEHLAFQWACMRVHLKMAEMFLEKHDELEIDLNAKGGSFGLNAFSLACKFGQSKIVEMFLEKQEELKIDLNEKDCRFVMTAFSLACKMGHSKIVEIIMQKSVLITILT